MSADLWSKALAAERAAWAAFQPLDEATNEAEYEAAEKVWSALDTALMAIPAPDLTALREKLDRLYPKSEDGKGIAAYAWPYACQTIMDVRRLLPGGDA